MLIGRQTASCRRRRGTAAMLSQPRPGSHHDTLQPVAGPTPPSSSTLPLLLPRPTSGRPTDRRRTTELVGPSEEVYDLQNPVVQFLVCHLSPSDCLSPQPTNQINVCLAAANRRGADRRQACFRNEYSCLCNVYALRSPIRVSRRVSDCVT